MSTYNDREDAKKARAGSRDSVLRKVTGRESHAETLAKETGLEESDGKTEVSA